MSRQKILYRACQLAALVLVISWWWLGLRQMNYVDFSRTPLPQVGQIVPYETKGIIVCITSADASFDRKLTYTLIGAGIITLVCLVISGGLSKILNPARPPPPPEL
jgi:hypothetical protein